MAFADHANVADESIPGPPATPTATLTGSSVAALVASSAAAWTWFFADDQITPPLKPYQIMELLYDIGAQARAATRISVSAARRLCPVPRRRRR